MAQSPLEVGAQESTIRGGGNRPCRVEGVSKKPKLDDHPAHDCPNPIDLFPEGLVTKSKVASPRRQKRKAGSEKVELGATKLIIHSVVVSPHDEGKH